MLLINMGSECQNMVGQMLLNDTIAVPMGHPMMIGSHNWDMTDILGFYGLNYIIVIHVTSDGRIPGNDEN